MGKQSVSKQSVSSSSKQSVSSSKQSVSSASTKANRTRWGTIPKWIDKENGKTVHDLRSLKIEAAFIDRFNSIPEADREEVKLLFNSIASAALLADTGQSEEVAKAALLAAASDFIVGRLRH